MKILITGSTGYIGSRLIKRILKSKDKINILVRNNKNKFNNKIKVIFGDIQDLNDLIIATKNIDKVIHIAGDYQIFPSKEKDFYDINYLGTKNLLEAAYKNKVKEFIYISTALTCRGKKNFQPFNENTAHVQKFFGPYEESKYLAERECFRYMKKGMKIKIINPTIVFGEKDPKIIGDLMKKIISGKLKFIFCGNSKISLTYIDDLINAIILIDKNGKFNGKYIVSTGDITLKELVIFVNKFLKCKRKIINYPDILISFLPSLNLIARFLNFNFIYDKELIFLLKNGIYFKCDKIKNQLSYKPSNLFEALEKTAESFIEN